MLHQILLEDERPSQPQSFDVSRAHGFLSAISLARKRSSQDLALSLIWVPVILIWVVLCSESLESFLKFLTSFLLKTKPLFLQALQHELIVFEF
jgi:hypothetical protein